jgi:hypothetical protein
MFLEELVLGDAVRESDHRQRAIRQMRQHVGRYPRQVNQQVAFGDGGLLQRRVLGPQYFVQVGQTHRFCSDRERHLALLTAPQLLYDLLNLIARGPYARRGGAIPNVHD